MPVEKIGNVRFIIMALVFLAIVLAIGLAATFGGGKANPSPEQWIAAAHDIGEKPITHMNLTELQIISTAIQVEWSRSIDWKIIAATWGLGLIAASVVVRVVFIDILRWEHRRTQ